VADIVVIRDPQNIVVVQDDDQNVVVASPGPAGPTGPQGPAGAPGGSTYTHTQTIAASQWDINHGLGRYPHVTLIDSVSDPGDAFLGLVRYVDEDNISIVLNQPVAGRAELA
jgi:hypothetical protein